MSVLPSELAAAGLRLNQTRFDFDQQLREAETPADIARGVRATDAEIRSLAAAPDRFAVGLATPKPKRAYRTRRSGSEERR